MPGKPETGQLIAGARAQQTEQPAEFMPPPMNPKTLQYLRRHNDDVTMNTYTHLGQDNATDELRCMEELENARKELEKNKEEKPVSQKIFRAI